MKKEEEGRGKKQKEEEGKRVREGGERKGKRIRTSILMFNNRFMNEVMDQLFH